MHAAHDRVLTNLIPSDWISRAARRWLRLKEPENVVEIYILVITGLLGWFWLSLPTTSTAMQVLALVVSGIRCYEIFVVALGLIAGSAYVVAGKSLVTAGFYGIQMMLIFATVGEGAVASTNDWAKVAPHGHLDWAFLTFTNMFTLGNGFLPMSRGSKLLVMGSLASGLLVLSIFVAYAIGQYGTPVRDAS